MGTRGVFLSGWGILKAPLGGDPELAANGLVAHSDWCSDTPAVQSPWHKASVKLSSGRAERALLEECLPPRISQPVRAAALIMDLLDALLFRLSKNLVENHISLLIFC